jgi:hypothetical protein
MAEIIDEYIVLDERVPASANAESEDNSNFLEKAADSVKQYVVDPVVRLADSINMAEVKAGLPSAIGLRSMFSPEFYQEQKQNFQQHRARAARMAELQLQDAENRVQTNAFNLEQAKILAPLKVKMAQENLANIERQGRNNDQQFEQNKELFPLRKQSAKATADYNLLRLQQEQNKAWTNEYHNAYKLADERLKKQIGWEIMDDAGRAVIENSPYYKGMLEASIMLQSHQSNPEKAKFFRKMAGLTDSLNDKEETVLTFADGKKQFVANDAGIRTFMENMQKNFMDDVTAARIVGTDAQSIPEASAKIMLNNQRFLQVYGTAGNAYRALRNFMDQKVKLKDGSMKELFTPSQKMVHATSVTLDAAIEDNAFSQAEIAALSAQFVPTVKQFGGEVIWGKGVDDTQIIMRNNGMTRTYPIREFAQVLKQRDVITPAFNQHVAEVARKMKLNQAGEQGANDAAAATLTPEERKKYTQIYGEEFVLLPKDAAANVKAAETDIKDIAYQKGFMGKDKDGYFIIEQEPAKQLKMLKELIDSEEAVYKHYSIEKIAPNGYFHTLYEKAKGEQEKSKHENNVTKTAKSVKDIENISKSARGNFFTRAFAGPALDRAAATFALAESRSKNNSEKASQAVEKADRKLKLRGE